VAQPTQDGLRNHLLTCLSAEDFRRLAGDLEPCRFGLGEVLYRAGEVPTHAWFPEEGVGSLIATSPEGHRVESGLFGRDGFTAVGLVMDAPISPYDGIMQVPGHGWRIEAKSLRAAIVESLTLRDMLLRYAHALSIQITYTALSNSVHPIDERLARWLLMCHDRIVGQELELTHEFLSLMLAVRRPSVTTAIHVLEGNGFIRSERRCITIRNRAALEEFAGDAYGRPEEEYRRLLGPFQ
jgi:CRP-like cAMP-binding protein